MVCEEDLAARVFRSWGQHVDPAGRAKAGAALAGGQTQPQAVLGPPSSTTAEAGPLMLSDRATYKAANDVVPHPGPSSRGEVAADGTCAPPQLPLSQQQLADCSCTPPQEVSSSAATPLRPMQHPQAPPPRIGTWEGVPHTSLVDPIGHQDEGAGVASAHRLGLFRFKGSPETLSLVIVLPSRLGGRR